jgi:hypothetical protein
MLTGNNLPMQSRGLRFLAIAVAALALAWAFVGLSGSPASASTAAGNHANAVRPHSEVKINKNFKIAYRRAWTFKSEPLHRCIVYIASGDFDYHLYMTQLRSKTYTWSKQRIVDPELQAVVYSYNGKKCGSSATVSRIKIAQYWSGYSCSYNPSISFSLPWGISLGFWPSCGNRNQVGYETHYGKGSHYRQYNSGSKAGFGNYSDNVPPKDNPVVPCYGVYPSSTAYIGNTSDSYGAGNLQNSMGVCLKKL